jgi:hypothetical protein
LGVPARQLLLHAEDGGCQFADGVRAHVFKDGGMASLEKESRCPFQGRTDS